jgi:phenylacetate-CoA ligase
MEHGYPSHYQIIVDRVNNTDTLDVNVEIPPEHFSDTVRALEGKERQLSDALKSLLGIVAKVHLVAPKTIVRSEGKAVRVIDKRKLH